MTRESAETVLVVPVGSQDARPEDTIRHGINWFPYDGGCLDAEDERVVADAHSALSDLVAERDRYREALEWFASDAAWRVTAQAVADQRFGFEAPPGSVYGTPWGVAREALSAAHPSAASVPVQEEPHE